MNAASILNLPWPGPALVSWALAWAAIWALHALGLGPGIGAAAALALCTAGAYLVRGLWRRLLLVGGFVVSLLATGLAGSLPSWAWLAALLLLLLAYPLRAWRDAPFFPTPSQALQPLADKLDLPEAARVLDAGCGAGHGLAALHDAWPAARCEGIEWSWPLVWASRLRCRFARVRRGDLWLHGWGDYDLVYLFQRPESMARAWDKARAEMREGAWLVSLEFGIEGVPADVSRPTRGGRRLLAWRIGRSRPARARR